MSVRAQVIDALRMSLTGLDSHSYPLFKPQCQRAIWAFGNCRTATLGWKRHRCEHCDQSHFSFHSCNHKSCPQCGKYDTAQWVERQLQKKIGCDYYMITFTLPAQLRGAFQSPAEKLMYQLFFQAASDALSKVLKNPKWLGAEHNGFMMVLHTWNQQMQFHPHIHSIVPAAGLDKKERYVQLKPTAGNKDYLVPVTALIRAFRGNFQRLYLKLRNERPDHDLPMPNGYVWSQKWGIDIKPVGDGARAIKYLARYVNRTAISDSRILNIDKDKQTVTFRWTDRKHGGVQKLCTLQAKDFARRFLLHVLPQGLRSIRYYGFCHPAAKRRFEKVAFHCGAKLFEDQDQQRYEAPKHVWRCPCCSQAMLLIETVYPLHYYTYPCSLRNPKQGPDP